MREELAARNVQALVIGCGNGTIASWITGLFRHTVPVLVDRDLSVYKSLGFTRGLGIIQRTGTVLIDRHGVLRYARRTANATTSFRREELRRAVLALEE